MEYAICQVLGDGGLAVREMCPTLVEAVATLLEMQTLTAGANRYDERVCEHGIKLNYDPALWRITCGEVAWQIDCDGTASPL